jgi:hypothetical protein
VSLGSHADRERAKLTEQVTVRLDEELVAKLDAYVRRRVRETRIPLSRSMGVREILEAALAPSVLGAVVRCADLPGAWRVDALVLRGGHTWAVLCSEEHEEHGSQERPLDALER